MDEFDVMRALQDLDPQERARVITWAGGLNGTSRRVAKPTPIRPGKPLAEARKAIAKSFKGAAGTEQKLLKAMSPRRRYRPGQLAHRIKRSPSYVCSILNRLHKQGLVIKISRGLFQKPPTK